MHSTNDKGGADGALVLTSPRTGERLAKYNAHYGPLNSVAVAISGGRELVLTGGDDGIARVWDPTRVGKDPIAEFDDERDCPVTAVEWSKDGNQCYVGGVDNEVKVWDLRKGEVVFTLRGHTDTVSSSLLPSPNVKMQRPALLFVERTIPVQELLTGHLLPHTDGAPKVLGL
jgi:Prp8 binding protein